MLITGFAAGPLGANCYVVATGSGAECVVVDPGQRAVAPLEAVLDEHRLRVAAVLVTHGHFDHVMSAAAVCARHRVPVYLGAGDVPLLTGQLAALAPEFRSSMTMLLKPGENVDDMRPDELVMLGGGEHLHVAGLDIDVLAVPGHTPGSVTYRLAGGEGEPDVLFTGDTLFAGTIGRTDLPGGSTDLILESIAAQLLPLPDDTVVLPGHGADTTIGAERRGNPFLAGL